MSRALENLKNLHYNGLLLKKVYSAWAKISVGEFCLMALNTDATFEGKLTCGSKSYMSNLANFYQSLKIGTLMGSFYPKFKIYELKIYRRNLCHDNEEWSKIWREIDLPFQNWHEKFDKFWLEYLKIPQNCTLIGCFWPKYITLGLKRV